MKTEQKYLIRGTVLRFKADTKDPGATIAIKTCFIIVAGLFSPEGEKMLRWPRDLSPQPVLFDSYAH